MVDTIEVVLICSSLWHGRRQIGLENALAKPIRFYKSASKKDNLS